MKKTGTTNEEKRTIVIYTRQSKYKENSTSQESQAIKCMHAIKCQHDDDEVKNIVTLNENPNMSGATLDRPQLKKMIQMIKDGEVSEIYIYKLDRLSRSLKQFLELTSLFDEYNVKLKIAVDNFDMDTNIGKMFIKMLLVFAEFERDNTINRIKDIYHTRSELGFYMGGRKPYGYDLVDYKISGKKTKLLKANATESKHVTEIFDTYSMNNLSLRKVLNHMHDKGFYDLSGAGWTTAKISNIIKNPIYTVADKNIYDYLVSKNVQFADNLTEDMFTGENSFQLYGKTKHNTELDDWSDMKVALMPHKGFIPSSTWIKCNQKLEKNKQIGNSISNTTSWIAGLVVCDACKKNMSVVKGQKTKKGTVNRYFYCVTKSEKKTCKGPSSTVYADSLEEIVYNEITSKLSKINTENRFLSDTNRKIIKAIENKIDEIVQKEDDIYNNINEYKKKKRESNCSVEEAKKTECIIMGFEDKYANLVIERKALEKKRDNVLNSDKPLSKIADFAKSWDKASYEQKKLVAQCLIECILIKSDGNLDIVWKI